jgi:hypothetical protein
MNKQELLEELEALKWAIVEDGSIPTLDEAIERVKQADSDEEEYESVSDEDQEPHDHYQEEYEVTNRE